jgi:threonine dehydratase
MALVPPTLADIFLARRRLQSLLPRTPLMAHPTLADEMGCDIRIKHENHLPTGAFKVRGGLNLVSTLVETHPGLPVITASTGNHGQSIALACQRYGVPCTILVPQGNNPDKNAAMRAFGATVEEFGRDFDEAREEVERRAATGRVRYVHSANEPLLIAGVGTYALEIFEEAPDVDVIFVPIGGGSGAFARSWRTGTRVTTTRADTFAEGVATRVTFDLPFGILAKRLSDVITLTEEELEEGVRLALSKTHNLAEGAAAGPLMAAWKQRAALRGQRVVCVMSGSNLNLATLMRIVGHSAQLGVA